jgi:thioredoxin-like negative regulator of GroEL
MFSTTQTININLNEPQGERIARQFRIKTVPTVIGITADGYMEKYEGNRTANGYQQWVNEITG